VAAPARGRPRVADRAGAGPGARGSVTIAQG
jgi:hypothetical protein